MRQPIYTKNSDNKTYYSNESWEQEIMSWDIATQIKSTINTIGVIERFKPESALIPLTDNIDTNVFYVSLPNANDYCNYTINVWVFWKSATTHRAVASWVFSFCALNAWWTVVAAEADIWSAKTWWGGWNIWAFSGSVAVVWTNAYFRLKADFQWATSTELYAIVSIIANWKNYNFNI